jgi:hypothetical protein
VYRLIPPRPTFHEDMNDEERAIMAATPPTGASSSSSGGWSSRAPVEVTDLQLFFNSASTTAMKDALGNSPTLRDLCRSATFLVRLK